MSVHKGLSLHTIDHYVLAAPSCEQRHNKLSGQIAKSYSLTSLDLSMCWQYCLILSVNHPLYYYWQANDGNVHHNRPRTEPQSSTDRPITIIITDLFNIPFKLNYVQSAGRPGTNSNDRNQWQISRRHNVIHSLNDRNPGSNQAGPSHPHWYWHIPISPRRA